MRTVYRDTRCIGAASPILTPIHSTNCLLDPSSLTDWAAPTPLLSSCRNKRESSLQCVLDRCPAGKPTHIIILLLQVTGKRFFSTLFQNMTPFIFPFDKLDPLRRDTAPSHDVSTTELSCRSDVFQVTSRAKHGAFGAFDFFFEHTTLSTNLQMFCSKFQTSFNMPHHQSWRLLVRWRENGDHSCGTCGLFLLPALSRAPFVYSLALGRPSHEHSDCSVGNLVPSSCVWLNDVPTTCR